jgi:type II secretory pathway component PulF
MTDANPPSALSARSGLSSAELSQFNSHLAALATAGLPLEQGIRLAAGEAGSARVRRELEALATDLESGTPLAAAFERRRGSFPTIYAALMEAAVSTGKLPALLLSLGCHQRTTEQLKSALARSLSYPLILLAGVCVVTAFVSALILPQMRQVYALFWEASQVRLTWNAPRSSMSFPLVSGGVMAVGPYLPFLAGTAFVGLLLIPVLIPVLRAARLDVVVADWLCRLPVVGPAIRFAAIARFADALAVGVGAPVDLPRALRLAGGVVGYPRLVADAGRLATAVEEGRSVAGVQTKMLPAAFAAVIASAGATASLPESLEALALMYRQQAELRSQRIPLVLLPLALLAIGGIIAILVAAIMLPLSTMLRGLT